MATPRFAFPRESRLTKTDEFSSVFSFRKRISGHFIAMHYMSRPEGGGARLGLIVSKRIAKRAVDRNYMKRAMRELFRTEQQKLPDVDLVIRMQRPFQHQDFERVRQEFAQLLGKLQRRVPA